MLYILSGTSRSGKTMVAREFLKKTGIPYMSVDAIMMGFTNGIQNMVFMISFGRMKLLKKCGLSSKQCAIT